MHKEVLYDVGESFVLIWTDFQVVGKLKLNFTNTCSHKSKSEQIVNYTGLLKASPEHILHIAYSQLTLTQDNDNAVFTQ